jgi:hypothetical protein
MRSSGHRFSSRCRMSVAAHIKLCDGHLGDFLRRWRGRRTRQAVRSLPPRGNEWSDHEVAAMDDNRAGLVTASSSPAVGARKSGAGRRRRWGGVPEEIRVMSSTATSRSSIAHHQVFTATVRSRWTRNWIDRDGGGPSRRRALVTVLRASDRRRHGTASGAGLGSEPSP